MFLEKKAFFGSTSFFCKHFKKSTWEIIINIKTYIYIHVYGISHAINYFNRHVDTHNSFFARQIIPIEQK